MNGELKNLLAQFIQTTTTSPEANHNVAKETVSQDMSQQLSYPTAHSSGEQKPITENSVNLFGSEFANFS